MDISSPEPSADNAAIEVKDLHTYYHMKFGIVKAVNGVSFTVPAQHSAPHPVAGQN
jgi:hypothetical protein